MRACMGVIVATCVLVAAGSGVLSAQNPGVAAPPAAPAPKTSLKVVGLSVSLPEPESRWYGAGTHLSFQIADEGRLFAALDLKKCKVELFQDDKGTDFLSWPQDAASRNGAPWELNSAGISRNAHACRFSVGSSILPARGAKELRIKGKVVVICGSGTRKDEQKDVALVKHTKVAVGPFEGFVGRIENRMDEMVVCLDVDKAGPALEKITDVRFLDGDGKEIAWAAGSHVFVHDEDDANAHELRVERIPFEDDAWGVFFTLKGKHGKVTIEVTSYEKLDPLEVPVDAVVTVGL